MLESATTPMRWALGIGLSGLMVSFHGKEWVYYERKGEMEKVAKALVLKIEEDPEFVERAINSTYKKMESVFGITKVTYREDLTKKSNRELLKLFLDYCEKLKAARGYGWIAPALDISGFFTSKLEGILGKYLKGREDEIPKYFNALTTPSKITTMREEEEELLELAIEARGNASLEKIFMGKNEPEIIAILGKKYPSFLKKIKLHYEKYTWLPVIFEGEPWKLEYFASQIAGLLRDGNGPGKELERLKRKRKNEFELKKKALYDIPLTKGERHLFKIASDILHFKAERKDLYQKSYFEFNPLLVEIGKRAGLTLAQVRFMLPEEVKDALLDGKVDRDLLNSRIKFCVAISKNNETRVLIGKEAEKLLREQVENEAVKKNVKELKGQCANPGFARGMVKIVLSPTDIPKMNKGDILVAQATNPDVVPAMRKAAAIVTNTGGITCHAAIVSREMGIPCIVGTKIATDVLRDGMEVEVDATKGIIRMLKKEVGGKK